MRIRFTVAMIALLAASEVRLRGQRVCQIGTICPKEGDPRNLPPPDGGLPFPDDPKTAKFTAGDCRDLPNHHVSADGKSCVPNGGCPIIPMPFFSNPKCTPTPITGGGAVDPNDKAGPVGPGAAQFITASLPIRYTVFFENLATATLPAQRVLVTDPLDPAAMDLSTLSLGTISFGDARLNPPPGLKSYSAAVDLRPAQNIIVHINAALDAAAGVLRWQFDSIDPDTMQVTTDPLAGFLPPNTTPPAGQGSVSFAVMPTTALATGTTFRNQATVIFDVNAPIATLVWSNTLDTTSPVTRVLPLAATQAAANFQVQWSGNDAGAGIALFSVYTSDNGGPFTLWQDQTAATSATFTGQPGHTYGFYSIGLDLVGNQEAAKSSAEASTQVGVAPSCAQDVTGQVTVARSGYGYNFNTGQFVQTVTLTSSAAGIIAGPISLVLDSLSSNATLAAPSGATTCAAPLGSPYINLPGPLNPGASASVTLQFNDPTKGAITYTARILAGGGSR